METSGKKKKQRSSDSSSPPNLAPVEIVEIPPHIVARMIQFHQSPYFRSFGHAWKSYTAQAPLDKELKSRHFLHHSLINCLKHLNHESGGFLPDTCPPNAQSLLTSAWLSCVTNLPACCNLHATLEGYIPQAPQAPLGPIDLAIYNFDNKGVEVHLNGCHPSLLAHAIYGAATRAATRAQTKASFDEIVVDWRGHGKMDIRFCGTRQHTKFIVFFRSFFDHLAEIGVIFQPY